MRVLLLRLRCPFLFLSNEMYLFQIFRDYRSFSLFFYFLARFPFTAISPDKHHGRCPESRIVGARCLASRRPFPSAFTLLPPLHNRNSVQPTTTTAHCIRGKPSVPVFERIPVTRRQRRDVWMLSGETSRETQERDTWNGE